MGNKKQTIPLTEKAIKAYLDNAIRRWRKRYDAAKPVTAADIPTSERIDAAIASCYIDAFQSVRTSLFGELLPKE